MKTLKKTLVSGKKTLVSGLVLAMFTVPTLGQVARAQVADSPATSQQIDDLKSTLITLLTQMIAQLQEQINQILATQTQQAISAPASNDTDSTQANVSASNTVASSPAPTVTISLGSGECNLQKANQETDSFLPIVVAGDYQKITGRLWNDDFKNYNNYSIAKPDVPTAQKNNDFGFHYGTSLPLGPYNYELHAYAADGTDLATDSGTVSFTNCN